MSETIMDYIAKVKTLETTIKTLQETMTNYNTRIDKVEEELNTINSKKRNK